MYSNANLSTHTYSTYSMHVRVATTRFAIITLLYLEQIEWHVMLISIQSITLLFQKSYTCF